MAKIVEAKEKDVKVQKQQPKAKKKTTDKWKKKAWYTIVAPQEFESREIGETISEKPEALKGRVISVTGRELANQPKKQHIQLKFSIVSITGNKAITQVIGHEIRDSFLRRLVRRRSSKIMTVKNYTSKDGVEFRVKTVIVTERKASVKQKTSIRKKAEEVLAAIIREIETKKIVDELVFGQVSNKVYGETKKIFPVKRVEITKSLMIAAK